MNVATGICFMICLTIIIVMLISKSDKNGR